MSILNSIKFLFMSQEARVEDVKRQVENLISSDGVVTRESAFEFNQDGFILSINSTSKVYKWSNIFEIAAYKEDLITIDDVRLEITLTDTVLTISEDTPGFTYFIDKLKAVLSGFDSEWESKVLEPPFQSNYTIIYRKKDA